MVLHLAMGCTCLLSLIIIIFELFPVSNNMYLNVVSNRKKCGVEQNIELILVIKVLTI